MRVRATALAVVMFAAWIQAQPPADQAPARVFQDAVTLVDARNDCARAVPLFERVAASGDRALSARALVYAGSCYERLGNEKARQAYRRVIDQYAEQRAPAAQARARLAVLEGANRVRQALVLRRLWDTRPPSDLDWAGPPSRDGGLMPMFDDQRRLVLMDGMLAHRAAPVLIGSASDGLSACTIWDNVILSPDARQAAFSCEVPGNGYELRVATLDRTRSQQRRVASGSFGPMAWLPGDVLLAQVPAADERSGLGLVSLRDGRVRVVSAHEAPSHAAVSPDRRAITFDAPQTDDPARLDVVLMRLEGGPRLRVGWPSSDEQFPAFTPDGRGVVFVSDRTGSQSLWLQEVDGERPVGTPRVLTQDLGRVAGAWGLTTAGSFLYFRQTGLVDVYVVDLDGTGKPAGPPRPASNPIGAHMWSAWSPDGTRLAVGSSPFASRLKGVTVVNVAERTETVLGTVGGQHLRWSPDGSKLAFRGRDAAGRYGFYAMDTSKGSVAPLHVVARNDESDLGACAWDADGRGLLYHERGRFHRVDLASGHIETVPFTADITVGGPFDVLREDGSLVFVRQLPDSPPAVTIARPDGRLVELFRQPTDEQLGSPAWMPDGRSVLVTRARVIRDLVRGGRARWPSLWRIDVESKAVEPLNFTLEGLRDVWVSPDGRHLAFTAGWPALEPWVVEHFLPPGTGRPAQ